MAKKTDNSEREDDGNLEETETGTQISSSFENKSDQIESPIKLDNGLGTLINIRESIIQGSFLPVTLLSVAGKYPINEYVID